MRVLLDVLSPKMAMLAFYIRKALLDEGFDVEVIARDQTQTLAILDMLRVPYKLIGRYGTTLKEKLQAELQREQLLLDYMDHCGIPDVLWSKGSVSGFRVAFGLKIPIVCTNDTLHNEPVVRLTVPLVDFLVIPEAYKAEDWSQYGISKARIIRYKGLEEVTWMKNLRPNKKRILKEVLGEVVDRLIVVREIEYKSSYYSSNITSIVRLLAKSLENFTILYIPRYKEDYERVKGLNNVRVPKKIPYAPELLAVADLVISSGGTMCTEAALAGTPVINYFFWTPIAEYLKKRGLPIWYAPYPENLISKAKEILKKPETYRVNTELLLEQMESPVPKTVECIKRCLSKY